MLTLEAAEIPATIPLGNLTRPVLTAAPTPTAEFETGVMGRNPTCSVHWPTAAAMRAWEGFTPEAVLEIPRLKQRGLSYRQKLSTSKKKKKKVPLVYFPHHSCFLSHMLVKSRPLLVSLFSALGRKGIQA